MGGMVGCTNGSHDISLGQGLGVGAGTGIGFGLLVPGCLIAAKLDEAKQVSIKMVTILRFMIIYFHINNSIQSINKYLVSIGVVYK